MDVAARFRYVGTTLIASLMWIVAAPANCQEEEPRWIYQSKPVKSDVAVVFVHGILGDTLGTWTNSAGGTFFRFLKDNPDVGPKLDIFAFGFTSRMFGGGSLDIREAATKLDEILQYHEVWSYSKVVIVAHSMGGLVALRSLSTRPNRRAKVPLLVFYATPQEGSQVAEIGSKVAGNPALRSMFRMDSNAVLKALDDDWRQLDNDVPYIACAYETKPYLGAMIVPFSSSTRLCRGNALAVGGADHLSIAKPTSPTADSVVFLVNRLKERVFNASQPRSFLTPDFSESGDALVFVLKNKNEPSPAKLINNTNAPLTYIMSKFSDRRLFYWPRDMPRDIPPKQFATLEFAAPLGNSISYSFFLQIVGARDQKVIIRVPRNPQTGSTKTKPLSLSVASTISAFARDASSTLSPDQLVAVASKAVERELERFPVADRSIVLADLLADLNLPDLASLALDSAPSTRPQAEELRKVLAAQLSGSAKVDQVTLRSVFLGSEAEATYADLAASLQRQPLLKGYGLSIEGDLAYARGEASTAKAAYSQAVGRVTSPLITAKLASLNALQTQDVRVGIAVPLTGGLAHLGQDNERGARLALDELNAKGLILGGRIANFQLIAEDDAGDPRQGAAVARKLVDLKVNGVIGHLNSGTSIPASKVYSDAGIPQISPSATNPKYTRQGYRTTFRVVADDAHLGDTLGRYAVKELKGKSIAVIDDRTAYGQGVAEEFAKAVKASGGMIAGQHFTTDKATDFTAILTAIKAKKPDVVFYGGMDAAAGPMIRQMKQLGIDAKFMGGDGICSTELPKLAAGAIADGQVICAEAGGVDDAQKAASDKFREDFKRKFKVDVELYSPYVYDAVNVLVDAMVRAGSAEPAKYLPVLARTTGYKGVSGTISFDEKGDNKSGALTLFTYKGDRREQISVIR